MYLKWKKEEEEIKRIDHRKGDGGEENKRDFWSSTSSSSSSYQEFAFFLGPYLAEEGPAAEIRNRFGDHSKISNLASAPRVLCILRPSQWAAAVLRQIYISSEAMNQNG